MWENRNKILHSSDHKWLVEQRQEWDNLISQFFAIYDPEDWHKSDRKFFNNRETVLNYSDTGKCQWIDSVKKAKKRFLGLDN